MKRFVSLLGGDIRFQWKYGFYLIYAFFTLLYITLIYVFPEHWRADAVSVILFSDPALLGLIFIGAIVLYEKSERSLNSIAASPVKVSEYVISKAISLGIISTLCGALICLASTVQTCWAAMLAGLFLGSCVFTFMGLWVSVRIANFQQFIVYLVPIAFLAAAPALLYKFWITSAWWLLLPGPAVLDLIDGGKNICFSLPSMIIWLAVSYHLAHKSVSRMFRSLGGATI